MSGKKVISELEKKAAEAKRRKYARAALSPESRSKAKKARAEGDKLRISQLSEDQRAEAQRAHAEAERLRRSQLSEDQRAEAQRANAEGTRQRRSQLSDDERAEAQRAHAEAERLRRSRLSDDERAEAQKTHAEAERLRRSQLSDDVRDESNKTHAKAKRLRQSQLSKDQVAAIRTIHLAVTRKSRQKLNETEAIPSIRRSERIRDRAAQNLPDIVQAEENLESPDTNDSDCAIISHIPPPLHVNIPVARRSTLTSALNGFFEIKESDYDEHYCGLMNVECQFCHSLNFKDEQPPDKKFSICCHKGKVNLPKVNCPAIIQELLTNQHDYSANFLDNIRKYNSALAFASMGAQVKPPPGHGPYCFRVQGQVYHQSGPLHPLNGESRQFAQLYILDPDEALEQRMGILANEGCIPELMNELGELILEINPFAQAYKMMREVEIEESQKASAEGRLIHEISMAIVTNRGNDPRRYNAPRVNEVAIVFTSADGAPPFERDIRVNLREENRTQRISILHSGLDAMSYPLLFPNGDEGWKPAKVGDPKPHITQLQYYSHRLAVRKEFNPILSAGKLTQQYCVDSYCKIEANRLNWIEQNQKNLRVEKYKVLQDFASRANERGLKVGKQFILPSSFQGSPRAMTQHYQDAMAIVRKYGKPDLFITMTCNPKWKEIVENLESWQKVEYRPDLVARVFNLKLKALLEDLTKKHVFGVDVAKIHVIEFQKRGLPHAHILVILSDEFKPKTEDLIDKMVSAEIPDPKTHPRLHAIVMKNMIHGPCGSVNPSSPCMKAKECTKKFPKMLNSKTIANRNGFPLYRRVNTGKSYKVGKYSVDNKWVVPYNPYLLLKYNCHINTEICASIQSIKYLFKYIYKGHDCATIEVTRSDGTSVLEHNEVERYIDSRYVSAPEGIWRIYEYRMHDQSHAVQKLSIHLPNEGPVYFEPGEEAEAINNAEDRDDTLTAWFKLNQKDVSAHPYLYSEIPEHFTFVQKERIWKTRQKGHATIIGRMYNVAVSQGELFYLRLLLLHVRGAKSFDEIKTVDSIVCDTFKEAAIKRHLLADDKEWDNCLIEAISMKMPYQLRQLFATICVYCEPTSAKDLWEKHKKFLLEDFLHRGLDETNAEYYGLKDVEATLKANGKTLKHYNLLEPPADLAPLPTARVDFDHEQEVGAELVDKLNPLQKDAFDKIMAAVTDDNHSDRLFFLDGPGGSGKTFTYDTLYHNVTGMELKVACCASTGIAANLLPFGRTYHSTFGLGPNLNPTTVSGITIHSEAGKALRDTKIIVWDEVTMTPYYALDVIDRLLRDLTNDQRPFGGKVVLLGGDFRQCLPVVKRGNRTKIIEACLQSSRLWKMFTHLKLSTNMRVAGNDDDFREWLIKLGNGELTNSDGLDEDIIEIPSHFVETRSLITSIFGEKISPEQVEQFQNKAILCPKNQDVNNLNFQILKRLEGEERIYPSVDSVVPQENINVLDYPVEFLNTLLPSGTPPHKLVLKKGAIIMLLRNINSNRGLCNGTRLIVQQMHENFINATVLTGTAKGQIVFIPRIDMIPSDTGMPFELKRRQFPVMLAFAMTINKSQGQSLDSVGIYLPSPVFSHGQLYVAFSRARSKANIKVYVGQTPTQGKLIKGSNRVFTKNVVYKEVFDRQTIEEDYDDQMLIDIYEDIMLVEEADDIEMEANMSALVYSMEDRVLAEIPEFYDSDEDPHLTALTVDDEEPGTSRGTMARYPPPAPHNIFYEDSEDSD
jgi:PIF1-like helicase/Helitron helicase-like domain at N-terminus